MPKPAKVDPIKAVDVYMTKLIKEMEGADRNERIRFANTLVKWLAVKSGIDDPEHGSGFGDDEADA